MVSEMNQQRFSEVDASILKQVEDSVAGGRISAGAAANIRAWLTEPRYAEYAADVAAHVAAGKWQVLDDVFWAVIPFGTGGRRGKMYPIGTNAINDRTIGESAQWLADYVKEKHSGQGGAFRAGAPTTRAPPPAVPRRPPALSFLVRNKLCSGATMVPASHNPPSDNAVKVYWSTGGQV